MVIMILLGTGRSENQNKSKSELQRANPIEIGERSDEKNQVLLFEAVTKGDYKKVKEYLDVIKDINIKNEYGYTILHWSVLMGQTEIATDLISRGANINTTLPNGYTPLHDAAYWGKRNMVQLLISHGADLYVIDKQGKVPLNLAAEQGHREIIPLLKPLHKAVENGDSNQVVNMVRKIPKSLHLKDEKGWYPLHLAIQAGYLDIVKFLIARGANINARGAWGITPLRLALENNQQIIADYLFEKGACDQSDVLLLQKKLNEKEAVIWHLFNTGWVIRTKEHLLIFDYFPLDHLVLPPNIASSLSSGEINVQQINDQNVVVFVPIIRDQRHINTLLSWKESIENIIYIVGEDKIEDSSVVYITPRKQEKIKNMEITTIRTTAYGEGFVVKVDGLTIFYGGDHESSDQSWDLFTKEIDYLQGQIRGFDLIFLQMIFEEQYDSSKGVFYVLDRLKPAVMFPTTAVAATSFYKKFVKEAEARKIPTKIKCAENRGDIFFYNEN